MHKRTAEDALATGSLVTFCGCAVGSNNGFDDLYPRLLDIVNEKRKYQLNSSGGIRPVKRVLNHLHTEMMIGGFTEGHVHQENDVRCVWMSFSPPCLTGFSPRSTLSYQE